jgi:hypothetical protein
MRWKSNFAAFTVEQAGGELNLVAAGQRGVREIARGERLPREGAGARGAGTRAAAALGHHVLPRHEGAETIDAVPTTRSLTEIDALESAGENGRDGVA